MVTPQTSRNSDALTASASIECPVCAARNRAAALHERRAKERGEQIRRERIAREAYVPDASAETYDGPLADDDEPIPSCFIAWQRARRRVLAREAPAAPVKPLPVAALDLAVTLYRAEQLTKAAAGAPIDPADASAIRQLLRRMESEISAIRARIQLEAT